MIDPERIATLLGEHGNAAEFHAIAVSGLADYLLQVRYRDNGSAHTELLGTASGGARRFRSLAAVQRFLADSGVSHVYLTQHMAYDECIGHPPKPPEQGIRLAIPRHMAAQDD